MVLGRIISGAIEKLEKLVAGELKKDLARMDFEAFSNYHNSTIDCMRAAYGALVLYDKLVSLDKERISYESQLAEARMTLGKGEEAKKLELELKKAKEASEAIPALHNNLRDFLGAAVVFASDKYRPIIAEFAKDNGLPPTDIQINPFTEDYKLIQPVLGEVLEKRLYGRLQHVLAEEFLMPVNPEPQQQGIVRKTTSYILRKLRIKR